MGLDIIAYESVELVRAKPLNGWDDDDYELSDSMGHTRLYIVDCFRGAADGLIDGIYKTSGDVYSFGAGSYSGYNAWRRQLADVVDTTPETVWNNPKPGPFVELINFADNEGAIGPKTSAKLASDFAEWQGPADRMWANDDWFRAKYRDWRKAFEISAIGGVVKFY